MVIPGKNAFGSLVSETLGDSQCQPCGVDLTLREVHELSDAGEIDFDNSKRRISATKRLEFTSEGKAYLKPGCYKIVYNEYVRVPLDACAFGFPRSSVLRCGADVRTAVWDPGYEGRSESLLLVHNAHGITLHKDAKVLQLVFLKLLSAAEKGYDGQYKGENR